MKIDGKTYTYADETNARSEIFENDSTVYVKTHVGRGDNSKTIFGYSFNIYLIKRGKDSFIIDFIKSYGVFNEDGVFKGHFKFTEGTVLTIDYVAPLCAQELKQDSGSPNRFVIKLMGKMRFEKEERVVELNINFETTKVAMQDC